MKTKIYLAVLVAVIMTSCSTTFYQVYKATPVAAKTGTTTGTVYEDENVIISYNFWNNGGDIGFVLTNKSDKDIYLNMEESFFVLNGFAYPYFQNRVFTKGKSRSSVSGASNTTVYYNNQAYPRKTFPNVWSLSKTYEEATFTENSVAVTEEKLVCIPAGTSRSFEEYSINSVVYRDCNLLLYPTPNKISTVKFVGTNSPIQFGNRLTYQIKDVAEAVRIENEFYVSEITNYPASKFFGRKYDEFCGEKAQSTRSYFEYEAADRFYNVYVKKVDGWEK